MLGSAITARRYATPDTHSYGDYAGRRCGFRRRRGCSSCQSAGTGSRRRVRNGRMWGECSPRANEARLELVKLLYEATDGKPMEWRIVLGLSSKRGVVDYAVEQGWMIVEDCHRVCLMEDGVRMVRDGFDGRPPDCRE